MSIGGRYCLVNAGVSPRTTGVPGKEKKKKKKRKSLLADGHVITTWPRLFCVFYRTAWTLFSRYGASSYPGKIESLAARLFSTRISGLRARHVTGTLASTLASRLTSRCTPQEDGLSGVIEKPSRFQVRQLCYNVFYLIYLFKFQSGTLWVPRRSCCGLLSSAAGCSSAAPPPGECHREVTCNCYVVICWRRPFSVSQAARKLTAVTEWVTAGKQPGLSCCCQKYLWILNPANQK